MVNPLRNECAVTLNGTEYLLRATFGCLVEIEEACGVSIPKLMEQIGDNNLPIKHAKAIFAAGIKGSGKDLDERKLEEDMVNAGIAEVTQYVVKFLLVSTFGGEKIKKN